MNNFYKKLLISFILVFFSIPNISIAVLVDVEMGRTKMVEYDPSWSWGDPTDLTPPYRCPATTNYVYYMTIDGVCVPEPPSTINLNPGEHYIVAYLDRSHYDGPTGGLIAKLKIRSGQTETFADGSTEIITGTHWKSGAHIYGYDNAPFAVLYDINCCYPPWMPLSPIPNVEGAEIISSGHDDRYVYVSYKVTIGTGFIDLGLRIFNGSETVSIAGEPLGVLTSPLRITKNGNIYGIALVEVGDSKDSGIRIETKSGIKALRVYP